MSQKLFQYAALLHPTDKQIEDGQSSKVIVEITTVVAPDQNTAILLAAREIDQEYMDKLDRVEVVVRPF